MAVAAAETTPLVTAVVMARSMGSAMRAAWEKKMSTQALYVVAPMTMHPAPFAALAGQTMHPATFAALTMHPVMFAVATAPTMPDVAGKAISASQMAI